MEKNLESAFQSEAVMAARKTKKPEDALAEAKRKTREQLSIDRSKLLNKRPFIGSLLMRLDLVPVLDDRLPTAATNGDSIFVNIDFYAKLTLEERLFVLAHEAWHCALLHFMCRQNRDHEIFNIATDLEIHFLLTSEGLKAPFVLPHDPGWQGLSAEEIYARYPKGTMLVAGVGGQESENIKNVRKGGGFDTHLDKDDDLSQRHSDDGDDDCDANDNNQSPRHSGAGIDAEYSPSISVGAAERCRERLTSVVQQYQRMKGDLPLGIAAIVKTVLEPKINWREILAQFVTKCYGGSRQWLPPSRRHVWQGLYLQSSQDSRLNAVVAVDTSGSTYGALPRFFAELNGLLNTFGSYQLTVIQCDAAVQKVEQFDDFSPFPQNYKWEAMGFGGTDFRPVFQYVEEHAELEPNLLVYLTDGYGYYPERPPSYPVLWMVTPFGAILADWGLQCPLDDDRDG